MSSSSSRMPAGSPLPEAKPEGAARAAALRQKIEDKSARIGRHRPRLRRAAAGADLREKGFTVLGFDVDPAKIDALNRGESYIKHLDGRRLAGRSAPGRFARPRTSLRLTEPDVILICVPTPLTPQREPDMSFVVETAATDRRARCARGSSSCWSRRPTRARRTSSCATSSRSRGLEAGRGLLPGLLARARGPGQPELRTPQTIPKVVGGVDRGVWRAGRRRSTTAVIARRCRVSECAGRPRRPSSSRTSSARVNIALVNELKMVFDRMGIDVWEVLDAAATKPFGFMRFNPGPGWGGHCIPLDPFYLAWKAREYGVHARSSSSWPARSTSRCRTTSWRSSARRSTTGQGGEGEQGPGPRRGLQEGHRRRAREPGLRDSWSCCSTAAPRSRYHDPHVAKAPRTRSRPGMPPDALACR